MLNIGDKAPEFKINDEQGKPIALSDFKGKKVVLYFYPKDDTPGCTTEACGLRDVYDDILGLGAVVLGVSRDSENSHTKFKDKFGLPFHLLADVDNQVCEPYGAWGEKNMYGKKSMGINRITYIIDENGNIANAWPKVKPEEHAEQVLKALQV